MDLSTHCLRAACLVFVWLADIQHYPDRPFEGEPLNAIVSHNSSSDMLDPEGFLVWATYVKLYSHAVH